MEIEVIGLSNKKTIANLTNLKPTCTVLDIKKEIEKKRPNLYIERQSLRLEPKGKALQDGDKLESFKIPSGGQIYMKDLGPQIGWGTVFMIEYSGPLFVYLWFYTRPSLIYGSASDSPIPKVVHIAAACWAGHYIKRILETIFVHRFSHATMPLRNLFKNCTYYWGFAAYVAYYVNHPLYTSPYFGVLQVYIGLAAFIFCELGNLSIHLALKNLRPAGSKERKIPMPTYNPFTLLFNFVSCPNYTYETGAWYAFSFMTQCLPAGLFAFVGFCQMAIWALQKHRNYKKEFPAYPRNRQSILPFII